MSDVAVELSSFFDVPEATVEAVNEYADRVHQSFNTWERFDAIVREHKDRLASGAGDPVKLGVGLTILGRYGEALEVFQTASDDKYRHYYAAKAALALRRFGEAVASYQQAARKGWNEFECDVRAAIAHIYASEFDAAQAVINKHSRVGEDRADWYFLKGMVAEYQDDRIAALDLYEKALTLDPLHEETMFRAAWLHDIMGDEEMAIQLYESLATKPRARVNALMNLAILLEDLGRFREAMRCLRRVLRVNPNHARARLFLKDVESSLDMIIDEAADERADARNRLLDAPIGEFELSVRARNCLKKMNINTLGQLVQLTEAELLAYKNFGEASLNEIKQLLARKGLRLGQRLEDINPEHVTFEDTGARVDLPPGREAMLQKPVAEMELSVRSRRCLQRLNVATLGDLVQHSEADLMAARNFGVTSLNEIKSRLAEFGLSLAPKRNE